MNAPGIPHSVPGPECGLAIRAGTVALMGADHWQHLAKEHGMHRLIAVDHDSRPSTG